MSKKLKSEKLEPISTAPKMPSVQELKALDPKVVVKHDLEAMRALIEMIIREEEIFNLIIAKLDMYKQEAITAAQTKKEEPK